MVSAHLCSSYIALISAAVGGSTSSDKYEDGLLRRKLDALTYHVDELANSQILDERQRDRRIRQLKTLRSDQVEHAQMGQDISSYRSSGYLFGLLSRR